MQRVRVHCVNRLIASVMAGAVCYFSGGVNSSEAAPPVGDPVETSGLKLITPETQAAIDRGLVFLAKHQHEDGSFGSRSDHRRNVAVAGLCGMAFLSAGHTPGRGTYGGHVRKTVDFVLSRVKPNGFIIDERSQRHGPMYGHGFATLFLAESYGMSRRKDLRKKLESAVKLIVGAQNKEGGWRYRPESTDADVSVTVCQIMALRAARNCGIYVPKNTIDRCIDYVKKCQNSDGGFRYQLIHRSPSAFPRSAAGVVALYSAGLYEGREIERGIDYLMRHVPRRKRFGESHFFYGHYYAVQAMWHAGGRDWQRWYPAIRDQLLHRQLANGNWTVPAYMCTEYGTAMACLVLQMPNNYLPIFQR